MIGCLTMRRSLAFMFLCVGPLGCGGCGDDLPDQQPPATGSTTGCLDGCTTTGGPDTTTTGEAESLDTTGSPPSSSSSSDDGPSTVGVPDECQVSSDCGRGEYCVAPFVPEWGPEGKGPNECVTECVVIMDELRWCLDASACCDPDAVCTDRGYCVYPDEGSTGGGSTGDGGSGTTGG